MTPPPPEPYQTCKNKRCTRGFPPRSNKLFCSLRCKNKHHNDGSRDPQNPVAQKNKRLKANDQILLRVSLRTNMEQVPKAILEYEGYDFHYFTSRSQNPQTKQMVHWIYSFGLEKNQGEADTYSIHLAS